MHFMRLHWFDVGLVLAAVAGSLLLFIPVDRLSLLLWLHLIALFIHQAEEYWYPGYFPGMLNTALYASTKPDRYPLNTNTALFINVAIGWLAYVLAAVLGKTALWLAIATVLVSAGNIVAHTVLFNLKGKTRYNPGMLTALLLFLPIVLSFCLFVMQGHLASMLDWILGLGLGIVLNYVGILKLIDWLKDESVCKYYFLLNYILLHYCRYLFISYGSITLSIEIHHIPEHGYSLGRLLRTYVLPAVAVAIFSSCSSLDIIKVHSESQLPFAGVIADCTAHSKSASPDRVCLDTNDG